MKNTLYLLIAILLLTTGCNRPTPTTLCNELLRAEELMYPAPDSALHILQGMTPPADELNRATWALLLTQAKYKCNVEQTDSLLNIAHNYFMKGENTQRKALTLFCKAGLYEEQENIESATYSYLDAVKVSDEINDYRLRHLINVRLALLYVRRNLYDYAIEYCEKANQYALLSRDSFYITNSYNNLGRVYSAKKEYEKAISFYDKAIELGKAYDETKALNFALQEKAGIYILQNKFNEALSLMKMIKPSNMSFASFQILGHLYSKVNQKDSAYYYLNKAIQANDIYVQRSAYQVLFNLSKKQKDYEKNAEYSVKLWKINDSINKIDRNKALIEMQEKYNEQRVRDELTTQMLLQKQRTWTIIGIGVLVLLFVAYRIRLRNKERITRLAEAEDRIDTLSRMLEEAQKATSEEEKDQAFFKRILLQQLGVIRLVANTPTAQNQALLRQLAEIGNDEAPAEELIVWSDLYPIIDRLFDNFHARLMQRFGSVLTDKEVQTCCLVCAGFSTKEIAVITRQAIASVYVRKTSARQKMGAPDGADIAEWVYQA